MNVGVIGTGFVGLVTGACLANKKNKVICIDIDKKKIQKLNKNILPFYEKGLKKLITTKISKSIYFVDNYKNVNYLDLLFITVGTPLVKNKVQLQYIEKAIVQILKSYNGKKKILIILKSTIPPGTTEYLYNKYFKKFKNLSLINNPEFLREGSAVKDFKKPDRIIIGYRKGDSIKKLLNIYQEYKCPLFKMSWSESEISKYYSNTFFSLLITFANQFSYICDKLKDVNQFNITKSLMADRRISKDKFVPDLEKYLVPGVGFGGSCFPKDIGGIKGIFLKEKLKTDIFDSILKINKNSLHHSTKIIRKNIKPKSTICILGASFKEGTDDIRESRTLSIIKELKKNNYKIIIYDPVVKIIGGIKCKKFIPSEVKKYKNFILMTRWNEFKKIYHIKFKTVTKIIDLRCLYKKNKFISNKVQLIPIGNGALI